MISRITIILLIFVLLSGFIFSFLAVPVEAQGLKDASKQLETAGKTAGTSELASPEKIVGRVVYAVLSMVGVIFLAIVVYGGVLWQTARGNEEQAKKAKSVIVRAIIGMCVVFLAYAITYFVSYFIGPSQT